MVVLHGGFWRAIYGRWIMRALCDDLARRGYAAWNLEYRRVGPDTDGGFPNTLDDVAAGVDHLADIAVNHDLDLARVAVVGHSAGGHLALWVAGRPDPRVVPVIAIAQAGVADLRLGHAMGLGAGAIDAFMGGPPATFPERYAAASPAELVPLPVRHVLVHGLHDEHVPVDIARSYVAAARAAGDDTVQLVELDADHLVLIDEKSAAWREVVDRLP